MGDGRADISITLNNTQGKKPFSSYGRAIAPTDLKVTCVAEEKNQEVHAM